MAHSTSTWQLKGTPKAYSALRGTANADVAIIGGGMAGLLSAYALAKAGKSVVLLEASRLLSGATLYTTAFLTQVIDTDPTDMISIYGRTRSRRIWKSHGEAIDLIEKIVREEEIDCDFRRCSNFIIAATEKELKDLRAQARALKEMGARAIVRQGSLPGIKAAGYIEVKQQAKFHPLKFLRGIAAAIEEHGGTIHERSRVDKIGRGARIRVTGPRFTLSSRHVITTTYQPFNNPLEVFLKKGMYVSYVMEARIPRGALKEGTYEDMANPYRYFRVDPQGNYDRLILGGEDHRTEIKLPAKNAFASLESYLKKLLGTKRFTIIKKWSGPILEPADGLALIGEYDPRRYVATAFSGNGMTYSGITALIMRDLILGRRSPLAKLYDPARLPTVKQLMRKGLDYGQELVQGVNRIIRA